jgi:hypothetical protein
MALTETNNGGKKEKKWSAQWEWVESMHGRSKALANV